MTEDAARAGGPIEGADEARGHGFGTAPVFLASISTILGAVLFLRFGYAVAHAGLFGAILIIVLGHLVTVPTALAIAEIATNRKVEGGGEYFIISRSFGRTIGAAIGLSLYLSQAISVAFYMIAFAEAFRPAGPWLERVLGIGFDPRLVSLPATLGLALLVLTRGATLGVKALWVVTGVLALSLGLFFLGGPSAAEGPGRLGAFERVPGHDSFMLVFAIVFPAFTGMTAGVGLSGDLANPRRSIPLGILSATLLGLVVYVAAVLKLAASASPALLAEDQLVMARIAIWGPIVPIGLACATISSAIGSILVAPRTLQALALDRVTPWKPVNEALAKGVGANNEPRNATLGTALLALATVAAGNVDFVARIISMFFMVTYGALCAISFLEHFAARPSYRPSFRSKWWVSLLGAAMCLFLMFQMDPLYAFLALALMVALYRGLRASRGGADDLAAIFQGVMTQASRYIQLRLQEGAARRPTDEWRPSLIAVNRRSFQRAPPMQFMGWLCERYGLGTYLHFIEGRLEPATFRESRRVLARLVPASRARGSGVYVDTVISPSYESALAQSLQLPSASGLDNNTVLFEISIHDGPEVADELRRGLALAQAAHMSTLVLRHGDHFFGTRDSIHIWLTWHDHDNAALMILLSYILMGHPDWHDAEVRIFAAFPEKDVAEQKQKLHELVVAGRIPISEKNLRIIPTTDQVDFIRLAERVSASADLVVFGFTQERLAEKGPALFARFPGLRDTLFVCAGQRIQID